MVDFRFGRERKVRDCLLLLLGQYVGLGLGQSDCLDFQILGDILRGSLENLRKVLSDVVLL